MDNVLILGGSGLIGRALIGEMSKCKDLQFYATYFESPISSRQEKSFKMNIEDPDNISSILNNVKPQIVISCLRGDFHKQLIVHTKVAEHLKEYGGRLYFFSTANVFDNDLSRPHYEDDLPDSCSDYGQYKIACEQTIVEILHDKACILRLPQVWGTDSPRMNQLLNALRNNEEIAVHPKLFCNTNTDLMIAKQLYFIIEHKLSGIFHLTAEDIINQKDFYNELILKLGFNNARILENLELDGYFALLSRRTDEFPEELRYTNKSVIRYLTSPNCTGIKLHF